MPVQEESLGDKAKQVYEDAKKAVGNAAQAAKQTLGAAAEEVKGTAQEATQRAQSEGASAQSTVQSKAEKAYNEAKVMMESCDDVVWHAGWLAGPVHQSSQAAATRKSCAARARGPCMRAAALKPCLGRRPGPAKSTLSPCNFS